MVKLAKSGIETLDRILSAAVNDGIAPAVTFAASDINGDIYHGTSGLRVADDPSKGPVTKDSVYWVCSHTKLVASLAILQLVDQGKISLDTPVAEILPELADPIVLDEPLADFSPTWKPAESPITLLHLLNHSSGLSYQPKEKGQNMIDLPLAYVTVLDAKDPEANFFRIIKRGYPSIPLAFQPGTDFTYGYGLDCVGIIIRRLTGKNLHQYCKEFIFEPLGMKASFELSPELKEQLVSASCRREDGRIEPWAGLPPFTPREPGEVHLPMGGVGLCCTVTDYLTLLRHLLQVHAGVAESPIFSAKLAQDLFKPTLTEKGAKSIGALMNTPGCQWSMGLCLNINDWPGKRRAGSGCWFGWAGTFYFIDPTTGITAMFGSQVIPIYDRALGELWDRLEEALYEGLGVVN